MSMSINISKRHGKQLQVPDLEEDPVERKRILNVLAQRRYRRRKKEHLKQLEQTVANSDSVEHITSCSTPVTTMASYTPSASMKDMNDDVFELRDDSMVIEFDSLNTLSPNKLNEIQHLASPACLDPSSLEAYEASFGFPLPSLPSSPSITNSSLSMQDLGSTTPNSTNLHVGADETHLPVLELNLLRGAMAIARRIGVDITIWSPEAISPFYSADTSPFAYDYLPENLRPTMIQLQYPHHPVFDILPWPSVRDKLIVVFAQPSGIRPPTARSPTALFDLVYDMEDSAEGIRIWGDDPYAERNWEVGQKMFANWWWALNSQVVNQSNELRRNRGATILGVDRQIQEVV